MCVIAPKFALIHKVLEQFAHRILRPLACLLATVWLGIGYTDAQVCSIQLEPDTTICQGETVVLEGPPGFPNYQWSTGAVTQDITVGSSGTYSLAASYPTGELVTNGNFSGGNNGFTTQFNYNSTLTTDGNYWIGTNAATYHPQFFGTGNGAFMMLNAGWMHSGWDLWCQTIDVCPGQTYTLSMRAMSLASQGAPILDWAIDGVQEGFAIQTASGQGVWTTFTNTWTSGPSQTSANICIKVASGFGTGNDVGLDNISISATIVLTDEVEVTVTPLPVVDFGPDQALCFGETLLLDATVPGGTYLWQDGSTDPTFLVTAAGSYSVEVTANNCSYTEDIGISYNSQLVMELGPDTTLCDGETLVLDATLPGATYLWQDGSTDATFAANGPGTYSVTVFRSGCQVQDALTVNYNPLPTVDLGPDLTRCAGEQATFDATTPGATYLWQDGSTDPTLSASAAGTYSVTITVLGCEASDAVDLAITPLPVVDLGPDQTVCPGTDVVLDATSPGATYTWQDGSTTATYTATQPGTYTVDVVASACTTSTSAAVSHYTLPVVDLGPDVTICAGQSTTFSVNVPTASYAWSTGSVTASITAGTAGTYWVDVTRNGCTVRDSVLLNVTPLPVFDLGTNPSVCPGATTVLDATTAGATYVWSTGATSPTVNVGPGNYTVQVTVNNCPNTDAISVLAFPAAQVALGNDTTLCPGADLLLDATQAGATYAWNTGAISATLLVQTAGPYSITLTDANGCEAVDAITVDFASPVAIDLGADTVICAGEQLLLDATVPIGSYLWSTGAVGPTLNVVASGTYGVQVTQGNCVVSDAIDVQVLPLPVVDLGADTLLCPGEVLVLDATTAGSTYQWSTGETSPTIEVDLSALYSVIVTNAAGCIGSDDITVVYANPGSLDLGPDTAFCAGGAVLLDATLPGAGYTWNGGSTAPTLLVSTSGTYWVDVQQGACTVSDTVVVTVLPAPQLDLGPDAAICAGEDLTLSAAWPGASTLWNTGSSASSLVVNSPGTYSAVLDLAGCTATDSITVTVLTTDAVDLGPDTSACAGSPVMLDATTAGASYLWNTGAVSATLDASIGGTYWVTVSQGTCSASDTIVVDILPAPVLDLGNDVTLCDGEEVSLTAAWPGASTLWNTGSSATTLVVNTSGTYSAVLDLAGCTTTDSITVVVLTADAVDLGPDTAICAGNVLQLDATTAGSTYSWSDGSTGAFLDVTTAGTYWVEVSQAGCSASDTIAVLVNDPGTIDLGPDTTLCGGEELVLDATLAGATYLWNDGSTDAIRTVAVAGTYSVEASVGQCVVFDTIAIAVSALPVVDLGADADICPGSSASFDATQQNATYLWHTGSTEATFITSAAGTVSVTVTVDGCSAADAAEVTLLQGPQPALGADTILCVGASLALDVSEPGATYLWDDGTTSGVRTITAQGTFWVRVELNTCTASDTLRVDLFDPSSLDLGADLALCAGESATLSTGTTGTTQVWNTGETGTSITVSQAGTYWVEVQVAGCAVADTAVVSVVDLVAPDLGPDRSICSDEQVVLSVSPGAASVLWSTGSTDATLTASAAGTYGVTLSLDGCSATDDVVVDVTERIDELPLASEATLCPGSTLLLDAGTITNASYLWSTGDDGQAILVASPGTYSVVVTGTCVNAAATVEVLPGECMPFIFIPNAFTPNNDGINDVFLPSVNGPITRARLDVFDRWGELIFSTENTAAGWNGESNGTAVQDAVYSWTLTYKAVTSEGVQQEFLTGHVTLLR